MLVALLLDPQSLHEQTPRGWKTEDTHPAASLFRAAFAWFSAQAAEHARYIFQEEAQESAKQTNKPRDNDNGPCTLCVVKPHVVRDGGLGAVLSFVAQKGFEVRIAGTGRGGGGVFSMLWPRYLV